MSGGERNEPGKGETHPVASEEMFRLLVESVRDYAIFHLDTEGRVASWNAGARAIKGYEAEEIIGEHVSIFYPPDDRAAERPQRLLATALSAGSVEDLGWRLRKDGSRFWAHVVITALRDAGGTHQGFAKVTRDLSARRAIEERLAQTEARLAATLYSIGDAVLATDREARITMMNPVAEKLTGWSEFDAMGRPVGDVFHILNEDTRAVAVNPVARVLNEGIVVGLANHTALVSRDGTERPIADSGAPIRDENGGVQGAVLVFRDVTEARRAEEVLQRSEERLRFMIESVRDYAIFMFDPEGRVVSWNPGAERIVGYTTAEIVGSHFSRFFPQEDVAAGKPSRELEVAARVGRFEDEAWRVRKDGSRFWANVVISAMRATDGRLVGFTKVTRDLTERRRAEEERLRLVQAQEALRLQDEFISIASHELKTPLTALQLQMKGIFDRIEARDDKLARKIARATRASGRLSDLIEGLLDVSRIATGRLTLNLERFDLVEAARDVVERLDETARQAGNVLTLEAPASVVGRWDRLRLEQIITNLLANAFKYAPGSPVEITIGRAEDSAVVEVSDRGHGIPTADLPHIFNRFERASPAEHAGMGLGLYVARQVTEAHGGTIFARNIEGNGACFTVRLPLTGHGSRGGPPALE